MLRIELLGFKVILTLGFIPQRNKRRSKAIQAHFRQVEGAQGDMVIKQRLPFL